MKIKPSDPVIGLFAVNQKTRTENVDDRKKQAQNFRINLEIWDGKIRRGEQISDTLPMPRALAWEDDSCSCDGSGSP